MVDGQQVNLATIEQLLSTYSSSTKVKLSLQRPSKMFGGGGSGDDSNSASQDETSVGVSSRVPPLVKVLTGQGPSSSEVMGMLRRFPYIVLYVTREGITGRLDAELFLTIYHGEGNVSFSFF